MSSFQYNYLQSAKLAFINKENQESHFGILEIMSKQISHSLIEHLELYFNIDISGSMIEQCKDGNTKIHHAKATITNLLTTLYNDFKYLKISVIINGFESSIHKILDVSDLKDHDLTNDIFPKITKLQPLASTNIELALKTATQLLDSDTKEQTDTKKISKKVHILITDGDSTEGITAPEILRTFMPKTAKNIILGIGVNYNANALQIISSGNSSIFKHINEAETIGLYVAEIIHAILYQTIADLTITVENAEIYNFITSQWKNTLHVDSIASEQRKTYHIRSSFTNNIKVNMVWTTNNIQGTHSISEYTFSDDVIKYKHRQDVLELLHSALEFSKEKKYISKSHIFNNRKRQLLYDIDVHAPEQSLDPFIIDIIKQIKAEEEKEKHEILDRENKKKDIKQALKILALKLMYYMEEKQLQTDIFYIRLCKDLTVAIDSIDKNNAEILINTRLDSQGRQETYTCNPDFEDNNNNNNNIPFTRASYNIDDYSQNEYPYEDKEYEDKGKEDKGKEDEDKEDKNKEDEEYNKMLIKLNISTNSQKNKLASPYATYSQVKFMRGVSSTPIDDDDDE